MPDGSQSWKIIKTSANSSGRIAQACDRCRSKKIKCDGKLPQCTQCINVGFECKTSDKLSRRAFPRGYTETLEQRVRTLEKELRDANLQLEAKSKLLVETASKTNEKNPTPKTSLKARLPNENDDIVIDDVYRLLSRNENYNGSFLGSSSGRPFFELFKRRLQMSKNISIDFDELLPFYRSNRTEAQPEDEIPADCNTSFALPSKSTSEQLVQSFFQTWHALFPVLHRPSFQWDFEAMYTEKASRDPALFAQMWLVLAIAARDAIGKGDNLPDDHTKYFQRARSFIRRIQMKPSVSGLKALVLAQLYTFAEENYDLLWEYKTIAVGWAYKFGLHRSQKQLKLGPLTTEMRKRIFWSLYVLDAFSSAVVGLPRLLDDQQVDTEFPADLDDDFVTEMGFLSTPPGNFSQMSAAIALFRASRILSQLLSKVYSPRRVALGTIRSIGQELDDWRNGLPTYLRAELPNCVPSSSNFHSHAPILLLTYHWIRTLIHRPILASTLHRKDETVKATVKLAESSRAIISVLSALDEKNITTTLCLSPNFAVFSSCISIMEITLVYDKSGQIDSEGSKSLDAAMHLLLHNNDSPILDSRIRLLEQCRSVIPSRPSVPKIDTRVFASPPTSVSPPTSIPATWSAPPASTASTSFDFNFMRSGRLSHSSVAESVASSFDPSTQWTPPTSVNDHLSDVESSKNDILEQFLATIADDSYHVDNRNNVFSIQGDSPNHPNLMMPSIFDFSSLSDEESGGEQVFETSPGEATSTPYMPSMFMNPFAEGEGKFEGFKVNEGYAYKDDGNCRIHSAPNLFSEETGWAV